MRPLTTAVAALALTGMWATTTAVGDTQQSSAQFKPPPPTCTYEAFKPFSERVWRLNRWSRGKPGHAAIAGQRRKLSCASAKQRKFMAEKWRRDRLRYGRYRVFRGLAPYPGGGTWWAIPYSIVYCESGTSGLWAAANPSGAVGPYQLLGWGAPYPADTWQERMANHRIAGEVWAGGAGAGNWVCAG